MPFKIYSPGHDPIVVQDSELQAYIDRKRGAYQRIYDCDLRMVIRGVVDGHIVVQCEPYDIPTRA